MSVMFLMLVGCGPSPEEIAAREARLGEEVETYLNKVQDLNMQGQEEQAMALLDQALKNKKYLSHRERLFEVKADLMLMREKADQVKAMVLEAWQNAPSNAQRVFGRVHEYYRQRQDHEAILKWGDSLLAPEISLPEELHGQVWGWKLGAFIARQDEQGAKECVDRILAKVKDDASAAMLQSVTGGLFDGSRHDLAVTLIRYLESKNLQSEPHRNMLVTLSMRFALADKTFEAVAPAFAACVRQLPDDQMLQITRLVAGLLRRNSQPSLLEQCVREVIFNAAGKHKAVNYAAQVWVETGVAANRKLLPERLDALLNAKVSPVQVAHLFDRYFYEMVGDLDLMRCLCAVGERILAVCTDESAISTVKIKILDGAFITDNFDQAIQMLEKGIPDKDKAWHDLSISKVKAHRAMSQNKPQDAVRYFREFMKALIVSDQAEEYDPTSGIAYSREWILGRNASRIAKILESIPDEKLAKEAREEAKNYFREALKKAVGDADALKLLEAETKGMGL